MGRLPHLANLRLCSPAPATSPRPISDTFLSIAGLLARCEAAEQFAAPSVAAQSKAAPLQQQEQQQQERPRLHFQRPNVSAAGMAAQHPTAAAEIRRLADALWRKHQLLPQASQVGEPAAEGPRRRRSTAIASCEAASSFDGMQVGIPAAGGSQSMNVEAASSLEGIRQTAEASSSSSSRCGTAGGDCCCATSGGAGSIEAGSSSSSSSSTVGLPPRFTDLELLRYAILTGLPHARTEADRTAALQRAAIQVAHTAAWLEHHPFSTPEEMAGFGDLIFWDAPDADGRPVLHIRLAAAVRDCKGQEAVHFANAIITMVESAVQERLSDAGPDQLCVVMDCVGGSTLLAARISWVFKAVSLTLNHHYPARWGGSRRAL